MADLIATSARGYKDIAVMWTRAAMAYPASFWMMFASAASSSVLDFVGIWIMFHTVDAARRLEPLRDRLPLRRHRLRAWRRPTWSSAGSSGSAR